MISPVQPKPNTSAKQPVLMTNIHPKRLMPFQAQPDRDSVQFGGLPSKSPAPSTPTANATPPKTEENPLQAEAASKSLAPSASQPTATTPAKVEPMDRVKGAGVALKNDLLSWKWWGKEALISGAITLATCWLPGSQLLTIPLWMGISLAFDAAKGAFHPEHYLDKFKKPETPKRPAQPAKNWTTSEKLWGATKGACYGAWHGVSHHFGRKLLVAGALSLALCWLPGSQLILIPAIFCMHGAVDAVQGARQGFTDPDNPKLPEEKS